MSNMHYERCLDVFVLTVMSVLFITYVTFNQQKLTNSASKTDIFTFQVTNKMQFQQKLNGVFCFVN